MSNEIKIYKYGSDTVEAPAHLTADQVREAWSDQYPELVNAVVVALDDGTQEFMVQGGTKG